MNLRRTSETGRRIDAATCDPLLYRVFAERAVTPLFQPIVDLATRKIVGVEALARGPAGTALEFPDALFRSAVDAGLLVELDQLCAARAMETARDATTPVPPLVFINAEPSALGAELSPDLTAAIQSVVPFRTVLEFTERALAAAPAALLAMAGSVHSNGDAVALDDVGVDPISLAFLPLVEPEVVKLDMHLVHHPHDPATLATAAVVAGFAERTGATVLAEGVETEQHLMNALALGARWGQGWLFGRPAPLDALAGRTIDRTARLRPSQADLHLPGGTPFGLASTRNLVRRADQRMIDAICAQLLDKAATSGPHGVVLCVPDGPGAMADWPRRLAERPAQIGYLGVLSAAARPGPVSARAPRAADPIPGESTVAVLGPYTAVALCLRASADGDPEAVDFVLTHDRDLVQSICRMIMQRLPA